MPVEKDLLWNDCPFVGIIISLIMLKLLRQGLITSYAIARSDKKEKNGVQMVKGEGGGVSGLSYHCG